jgi:hypothetical protein
MFIETSDIAYPSGVCLAFARRQYAHDSAAQRRSPLTATSALWSAMGTRKVRLLAGCRVRPEKAVLECAVEAARRIPRSA